MPFTKLANTEPIPGYRLLAQLGCGGFGEVWKCTAPGGVPKAIKFVYGNLDSVEGSAAQAHEEWKSVLRVKDLRHPFLLGIDRVESVGGELVMVMELADTSLNDVLVQRQKAGAPGIARGELLRYMAETAEVLDLLNRKHGLLHLDIKPRNIFILCDHVKVGDFGLVADVGACSGNLQSAVTPLYAAPEVFLGKASVWSDQYSLACCYVELLTGQLPFAGLNSRQLLMQHLHDDPDLSALPASDQAVIARALSKDAEQRYPSCSEMHAALIAASTPAATAASTLPAVAPAAPVANQPPARPVLKTPRTAQMALARRRAPHTIAGYQIHEQLSKGSLTSIRRATSPDGRPAIAKYIYGLPTDGAQATEAVKRFEAIQHPALVTSKLLQVGPGCLVVATDQPRSTVRDRWQKCLRQKLPGIPRDELIGYLKTAAEALDYVYQQHSLLHLAVNPAAMVLASDGLQLADFGLAHLFWQPANQNVAQHNARYAPPELFARRAHRTADQYSLALLFAELLTGIHPFSGPGRARPAADGAQCKPDLSMLDESDRAVLSRALNPVPGDRFASCQEMVRALDQGDIELSSRATWSDMVIRDTQLSVSAALPQPEHVTATSLREIISGLIGDAAGADSAACGAVEPELSLDGCELTHTFRTGLPVGAARIKLDTFRQQFNGRLLREDDNTQVFRVSGPARFWRWWFGRAPAVDVHVQLQRPHSLSATPIDVSVSVRAVHCSKKQARGLVRDLGSSLLEGLHAFLLVNSDKRTQDRILWPYPIEVRPVEADGRVGAPIACRGKDISPGGIGFYLPHELQTSHIMIELSSSADGKPVLIPATLVRAHKCADGWFDVGALFRLITLQQSCPDLCVPA
jgi:serine/threonine protein kinase